MGNITNKGNDLEEAQERKEKRPVKKQETILPEKIASAEKDNEEAEASIEIELRLEAKYLRWMESWVGGHEEMADHAPRLARLVAGGYIDIVTGYLMAMQTQIFGMPAFGASVMDDFDSFAAEVLMDVKDEAKKRFEVIKMRRKK